MKKAILFSLIFIPVIIFLSYSLTRHPRDLPSVLVGKNAPLFTLDGMEGGTYSLETSRGRPVVINFWATWCGSCAYEHGLIKQATEAFGPKGVDFVAILYEDTPENAKLFMARYGKAAPVYLDPNYKTAIDYGVSGIPETFFVDKNGVIQFKQAGPLSEDIFVEQIAKLLP